MIVLKQNNMGFVDLDQVPSVQVVQNCMAGKIEAVSAYGNHFWLGDYDSVERANEVLMKLYTAKRANNKAFAMPPKEECNDDYCVI